MEAEGTIVGQEGKRLLAVIRIKGRVNVKKEEERTLQLLRLTRKYSMALYPSDLPGLEGMLNKVRHLVTWGEIDQGTLEIVLRKRGRLLGNRRISDEAVKRLFGLNSISELAEKITRGEIKLHEQDKIKPVFRLHPPKGGFKKSTRREYKVGGELGYRGSSINELILRMA